MSSLLHPVKPHFGLAAAGFVLAQMLWDLWGTISARLCSVCTSLFLCAQHTQTLLTGKYREKDKKQSLCGIPLFPTDYWAVRRNVLTKSCFPKLCFHLEPHLHRFCASGLHKILFEHGKLHPCMYHSVFASSLVVIILKMM